MTATTVEATVVPREYYSRNGHQIIRINKGQIVKIGESYQRIDEKIVTFDEFGEHGRLETDDPEVIAFLENLIAQGHPDYFHFAKHMELITPDGVKIKQGEIRTRELMEENALLKKLLEEKQQTVPIIAKPVQK